MALDEAIDDLRRDPDPRRAVIAAYARMEQALTLYGCPRRPSEAPYEYLSRVARDLEAEQPVAALHGAVRGSEVLGALRGRDDARTRHRRAHGGTQGSADGGDMRQVVVSRRAAVACARRAGARAGGVRGALVPALRRRPGRRAGSRPRRSSTARLRSCSSLGGACRVGRGLGAGSIIRVRSGRRACGIGLRTPRSVVFLVDHALRDCGRWPRRTPSSTKPPAGNRGAARICRFARGRWCRSEPVPEPEAGPRCRSIIWPLGDRASPA